MWILDTVDSNVRLSNDGEIAYSEPGIALVEPKQLTFGEKALTKIKLQPDQEQSQFWQRLDQSPVHPSGFAVESQADLVFRQLVAIREQSQIGREDSVWVIVPGNLSNSQLALLYGIAVQAEVRIADFVDRGVAAAANVDIDGPCVFVDIGLHRTVVTQLSVGDDVSKVRVSVMSRLGLLPLLNAWIRHAADRFLDSTRFDPRKFANTEQQLFDQLRAFTADIEESHVVHMEHLGNVRQVELTRAELASAANEHYRGVLTYIDQGCPVLLSEDSVVLPGLVDFLSAEGSTCFERGLADAADAISRLSPSDADLDSRALHVEVSHVKKEHFSPVHEPSLLPAATHVLTNSIAFPIDSSRPTPNPGDHSPEFELVNNAHGLVVLPKESANVMVNGKKVVHQTAVKVGDSIVASSVEYELIAVRDDG